MRLALVLSLMFGLTGAAARADQVLVFAASSLQGPLDRVAADFATTSGHEITISYAGSAALARQIVAGAPADLFLSAAPEWMQALADAGLTGPAGPVDLLGNRLVIVAGARVGDVLTVPGLTAALGDGLLAMGHVDSVPAGVYGRAALESLGLWADVQDQVVQVDNVRVALGLVVAGEAALGIVYASDAATAPDLTIAATFPADSHPPIRYGGAVIQSGTAPGVAADFLAYLVTPEGQAPFLVAGFLPPP
jgi:molybdate transport system substrate-binding protein